MVCSLYCLEKTQFQDNRKSDLRNQMQRHSGLSPRREFVPLPHRGLDRRRLTRVKEFIEAHLEGDLAIAQLAKVASLSQFHFARAFKAAVGQSPHQYVSAQRLE
jgi:AraC family transcriptional regulator